VVAARAGKEGGTVPGSSANPSFFETVNAYFEKAA